MDLKSWENAQMAVIGALLIDPVHCSGEIFQRARPESFSVPGLKKIYEAARKLWVDGRPIDPVIILDAAGGEHKELIVEAVNTTPSCANLSSYIDIVNDCARLSGLQTAAMSILSCSNAKDAAAMYEQMSRQIVNNDAIEDLSWNELMHDYIDRMADSSAPEYLSWGIPALDRALKVGKGKFVILAADSSVGKTALALQFAYHMANTGKRVGFFSLETDAGTLTDRLMAESQTAAVPLPRTQQHALSRGDYDSLNRLAQRSANVPLRIINKAETIEQIRARTIMRGFDVIFIDYVQLISMPGRERWDIVTNISIQLHRMAQQLGVTIVGLSQITPPGKDSKGAKAPTKDDLRESRQLKHDADVILIMSISSEGAGVFRELQIAKNKDGACARMLLDFNPQHMTFTYREPPKPNPYAEVKKAARKAQKAAASQIQFEELNGAGVGNPF